MLDVCGEGLLANHGQDRLSSQMRTTRLGTLTLCYGLVQTFGANTVRPEIISGTIAGGSRVASCPSWLTDASSVWPWKAGRVEALHDRTGARRYLVHKSSTTRVEVRCGRVILACMQEDFGSSCMTYLTSERQVSLPHTAGQNVFRPRHSLILMTLMTVP